MIELASGLSGRALRALSDLESRTLDVDGGRLKLEWGVLRRRSGLLIEDVLWWDADRLVGFVGLYPVGPPTVELAGMVDPAYRRRGIASALLDAALALCRERGDTQALLVIPGASAKGRAFALGRGAVLKHSEHALDLFGEPTDGPTDEKVTLRRAMAEDAPTITVLLSEAFGSPETGVLERLQSTGEQTLVIEVNGRAVGTVRLITEGTTGGVYGFAIDPRWQGRGIGRDVLRRVCRQLREEGADQVHLEVAVDNDRALGLYTSIGFTQVGTDDYYALACV